MTRLGFLAVAKDDLANASYYKNTETDKHFKKLYCLFHDETYYMTQRFTDTGIFY